MADNSAIEWTDATWNPVRGCAKVSPGCKHCYAETFAERFRGVKGHPYEQGFDLRLVPEKLAEPLRWKRPRRIFVNSMSDLFHANIPSEYIAAVFGVMASAPQHTFQVLTKRADRMRGWFEWIAREKAGPHGPIPSVVCGIHAANHGANLDYLGMGAPWPLPNVWLGTSVEDQRRADERIPHLLQTPAAVRFLSAEPLLGSIDLKGWGTDAPSSDGSTAPETWAAFEWPEWVPAEQRRQIQELNESWGRGPRAWLRDHVVQQVPATGARGTWAVEKSGWARVDKMATDGVKGRYLHSLNNIGRIITDGGETIYASGGIGSGWLSRWVTPSGDYAPKLHWVIVGGESGPGARRMDLDWVREIREQCQRAGVALFVKQLGRVAGRELGADSKGGDMGLWPEDLRIRQMPEPQAAKTVRSRARSPELRELELACYARGLGRSGKHGPRRARGKS